MTCLVVFKNIRCFVYLESRNSMLGADVNVLKN